MNGTLKARTLQFGVFILPAVLALSCASKSEELLKGAALADATTPLMRAVVWLEDDEGQRSSFWIQGKTFDFGVVAMHPDLVFPIGETLWRWREDAEILPLCDCAAWRLQNFKGDCPGSLETAERTAIQFTNLSTGEEQKISFEPQIDFHRDDKIGEFSSELELLGSVGPYLFIQYREEAYSCAAGETLETESFVVFDVETQSVTDLLSESEMEEIGKNERKTAFELIRDDNFVSVTHVGELDLDAIVPTYHPAYGVALTYRFSKGTTFQGERGETMGAYSRQITVPARTLPKKLIPFLLLPNAVHNFMIEARDVRFGGWIPLSCPEEKMGVLLETFLTSAEMHSE